MDIRSEGGKVLLAADQVRAYGWTTHTWTLAPRARDELTQRLVKGRLLFSGLVRVD